jgi:hypothetical protein
LSEIRAVYSGTRSQIEYFYLLSRGKHRFPKSPDILVVAMFVFFLSYHLVIQVEYKRRMDGVVIT